MNVMNEFSGISMEQMDAMVHVLATTLIDRDSLQNILETMVNAVMVVTPQGRVLRANSAASRLLGFERREELVGRNMREILADSPNWDQQCMSRVVREGSIRNAEMRLSPRIGEEIPVLFSASALRDDQGAVEGIVCAAQDIREHVRLLQELKTSQENFRAIVNKSADGILIIQEQGLVQFVNPAAVSLLNRPETQLLGMPFGFPLVNGDATEVDVVRPNGEYGIAEMRSCATYWEESNALLVTLRDVTETVKLREELRRLSMVDELTGLNNRRSFLFHARHEQNLAKREKRTMSLMFIDMDGMKEINDKLGHKVGDQALVETASILRTVFRESDVLARLGGDEFLVLTSKPTDQGNHACLLSRLAQELERHNRTQNRSFTLSLSVGVVEFKPDDPQSLESLIEKADVDMYQNKVLKKQNNWVPVVSPCRPRIGEVRA